MQSWQKWSNCYCKMYFRQIKCKYRSFNNEMTSFPLNIRISLGKDQRCDEYLSVNIMREDSRWSWLFEASRCQRRSQRWRRDQRTSLHPTLPPPETDNHQWYFLCKTHILQPSSQDKGFIDVLTLGFVSLHSNRLQVKWDEPIHGRGKTIKH